MLGSWLRKLAEVNPHNVCPTQNMWICWRAGRGQFLIMFLGPPSIIIVMLAPFGSLRLSLLLSRRSPRERNFRVNRAHFTPTHEYEGRFSVRYVHPGRFVWSFSPFVMTASFAAIWFWRVRFGEYLAPPLFSAIPTSSEVLGFSVRDLGAFEVGIFLCFLRPCSLFVCCLCFGVTPHTR